MNDTVQNNSTEQASAFTLVDNDSHERFELLVGDELVGILGYRDEDEIMGCGAAAGDVVAYMHTVVKEEYGGQGMAGVLVQFAMDCAREREWSVRPVCTYVQRYLGEHPEYLDLLAED
ncbi:GNAT family N-acetyltransferase [Rhodococcus sp. ARC_M6]|uniref:GNAT family N-acetyltransferase n=1 Tax=Rhodococcus sp. ARC_M6 TaxID=2928852 RepID=UPI001FB220DB|nr:GNAT family N-acetyltransferase [Rhodococcus sp. ARC_M6]MCJ0902273.1 N-acetyltransferase [Rhodococcus sp. ARC_M6]